MNTNTKQLITNYITEIWNKNQFYKMDDFLHSQFADHSLPSSLPPDKEGTIQWIQLTGKAFEHHTLINELLVEDNKAIAKIRMVVKHVGTWRSIEPTGTRTSIVGYRMFKIKDGKIIAHWALLDGTTLESQLKAGVQTCKVQH